MPYILSLILIFSSAAALSDNRYFGPAIKAAITYEQASISLKKANGEVIVSHNETLQLVPASTLKLLTSLRAIKHWHLDHRFTTTFLLRKEKEGSELIIQGNGDPFLVAEEIELIAGNLRERLHSPITSISYVDARFPSNQGLDGRGDSLNPYDAISAKLAANFNSINLKKSNNRWQSAEEQTPLTATAVALASQSNLSSSSRISIHNANTGAKHFCEILVKKLLNHGQTIIEKGCRQITEAQDNAELLYIHKNSRTLNDVLAAMMKYSNNFIANQLFLLMGNSNHSDDAVANAQKACADFVAKTFSWDRSACIDGAGLSRKNRLSASQLQQLLQATQPYWHLLPEKSKGIYGKTGTLNTVSTLAGYLNPNDPSSKPWTFVIMMNDEVPWKFREKIAQELLDIVNKSP